MKRPAFQFYPADWRGTKWILLSIGLGAIIPRLPACYAIYLDGELAYVGQTTDLAKRISAHGIRMGYGASTITKWGIFKSVDIKARFGSRMGDWAMREVRLINRLQPRLNCVGGQKRRGSI